MKDFIASAIEKRGPMLIKSDLFERVSALPKKDVWDNLVASFVAFKGSNLQVLKPNSKVIENMTTFCLKQESTV